jgi:ABC-type dipeptide/oligopeptide/nickel transport system permease component
MNVPRNAVYCVIVSSPGHAGMETWFYQHPNDSAGASAETAQAIIKPVPLPRSGESPPTGDQSAAGRWVGYFFRYGFFIAMGLLVAMLAFRHPFVLRRLALMVPMLAVISVIVFLIIQAPPGDFMTSKVIQYAEAGDTGSMEQIEELRTMFLFDQPLWVRYAHWTGLKWFFTLAPADRGLLQGDLGRSMETLQPVNNLVGDRIVLTVALSLGTILFTWALSIPIGIYSAARQYSKSDYALTLLGFVGMSVPGFLLALVIMAMTGIGAGLFSPGFATQPEWNWPKIVDLMKHLWVPVVVLGVGGTAALIRVMRANLLDELRKPYVTTARAKGVRPIKLLLKYPVRVAINPFVSGIGSLFPQLISGGAIVSIVLSLPTIGPQLLTALFTQDMYFAGSLLMVLSLLGVIGTLVSDLLLLWLDPRIRYEGGAR